MGDAAEQQSAEFMTVEEAANMLRVNPRTLYDAIKADNPPWAMKVGRIIRISRTKLLAAFGATPLPKRKR
jgi:excisionase family DNA binding protein